MKLKFPIIIIVISFLFACENNPKKTQTDTKTDQTTKVGLDNGRWISTSDSNAGVQIKDGKFIMFYKGTETSSNSIYEYELTEKDGIEYLNLKNAEGDEMIYGLLEYSEETMVLSYLDRGNTLTYEKE
ncbi:hypothetical protein C8N46_103114 [Kordia periserrulae]|uniref:Lipocalin-like protein n=1 Tax=Kordia periserrulae TaxID=701523 RepID=A0A2T6C134_9FLAO|nr:hypothetical protein [Kordia periserrulae]PTX62016.1 hypothetical protein C8N46_103114 [Kordia periserrulae]